MDMQYPRLLHEYAALTVCAQIMIDFSLHRQQFHFDFE